MCTTMVSKFNRINGSFESSFFPFDLETCAPSLTHNLKSGKFGFTKLIIFVLNALIMLFRITLFAAVVFTFGCGTSKKNASDLSIKEIHFHGIVHKPYCGGARPNSEVAAGYDETMNFEKFIVLKGKTFTEGMEIYKEITLDDAGNATFNLPVGEYMFMHADKYLSLDEFMHKNAPLEAKYYKIKGTDCFKTWKNTPDGYFTVKNDTTIDYRQQAKCWVGTNACLEYIGPPAP